MSRLGIEQQYLSSLREILDYGEEKHPERKLEAGRKLSHYTKGITDKVFTHYMSDGFPLFTHKKMGLKNIAIELEFFIKGLTDKQWLKDRGCNIWNEWKNPLSDNTNDLGPLGYSWNWRKFNQPYSGLQKIQTNYDKSINIISSDDKLVGKCFDGKYGKYTVISIDNKDKYHNKRFSVKFHTSGYVAKDLNKSQIENKSVFDPYFPSICNIACVGKYNKTVLTKTKIEKLKLSWRAMIHRCYDKNNQAYDNYGGKGIYVSDRWLIFENYLNDIQEIDGWTNKDKDWKNYQLDKDIKGYGYYSKESCLWVNLSENTSYSSQNYFFDAVSPDGVEYKNNIGLSRFCKQHQLKTKNVEASIRNNSLTSGGWKFSKKESYISTNKYVDQLKDLVETLKNHPNDRRMIVSAWNPNQFSMMALPPCHILYGVSNYNGNLDLRFIMRSSDALLGFPYNIASYGLLLLLLAKESGLKARKLTATCFDYHLYSNQFEAATQALGRQTYILPKVEITGEQSIFDWTHKDFALSEYISEQPLDKVEVVV